jgi:two-component system phosphate regulon sensor histidine kinase PhoR
LRAAEKNISLVRDVSEVPHLTGDGDRLAQVFTNLIDNAITHTPESGQVTVRAVQHAGGVQVTVSDTGPGIPPEDLSRIFERFYQVDKSRVRGDKKGTGLGLTISKEIVEAHGGRIQADSVAGQGASFMIWLPLPQPSDETVVRHPRRPH